MKTKCPHCKACFEVLDTYFGKTAKCSKCKQPFIVGNSDRQYDTTAAHSDVTNVSQESFSGEVKQLKENMQNSAVPHSFHPGLIPTRMRLFLNSEDKILFASNPSKTELFLRLLPAGLLFFPGILTVVFRSFFGSLPGLLEFILLLIPALFLLVIYYSWKNRFYIITDKRTIASEGIFNIAISIIPNKSIQMICVNSGIIDKLLGLNTLEVSSAAQGGKNIFHAFSGASTGAIKFRSISNVHDVIKLYQQLNNNL